MTSRPSQPKADEPMAQAVSGLQSATSGKKRDQKHCTKLLRKLSDFLDGELDRRTHKEVTKHIRECFSCLASYRSLKWSIEALRRYPSQPIPKRVRDQVRRQILHEIGRTG